MNMNSKRSISRKVLVAVFVITTLSMALLALVSIFAKNYECKKECKLITETYINEQDLIVKYEVERAVNDIEFRIKNSGYTQEILQNKILELLADARFSNKGKEQGIFFVRSYDGVQMLSVSKPELVGKDVSQLKDSDGLITHELFMNIVNDSKSGFADYSWFNPVTGTVQKKRSFIKGIPELQWYIGAGFWFDDINSVIEEKKIHLKTVVRNYIFSLLIIILISYITIFIVARKISKKIRDNFEKFSLFLKTAASQHAFIEEGSLHYLEFNKLADSANRMISERIKAEEDLNIMAHAFKSITDCVTITDLDNNILFVNDSFLKTYGYNHKEIVGKKIDLFGSPKNPEGLHDQILKETYKGGWSGELWNTRHNGNEFQITLSTSVIKNKLGSVTALVGVSKDISEQKRADLLQKIIYNISLATSTTKGLDELIDFIKKQLEFIIDVRNFYVAFYNEKDDTFTSPFMLDEKDNFDTWPAGISLTAYVYKNNKSSLLTREGIKKLEKSGDIEVTGTIPEVWLGIPLIVKGKVYGVFAVQSYSNEIVYTQNDREILEFVSHQISISLERKKVETELQLAYEKAMESDRLKSAFLATMTHELRTPLNAVIGFSELINKENKLDKILNFSGIINRSGHYLLEIVEGIFDATLMEAGQVNIVKRTYSISSIMQSVQELAQAEQIKFDSSIQVNYKPLDDDEMLIYTDKSKLKQILINLIKNAIKFTNEGYIEYGYEKIKENGISQLRFYVKDTGIGIVKDKQKIIFDIFRQADDSLTRDYGGTGIGLYVVKRFTEILGGKVELESEKGKGSTFYIYIPITEPIQTNNKLIQENKQKGTSSYSDKTILIVEDDKVSAKLLVEILSDKKINYLIAEDGNEAVKACSENHNIDLVLMDIKMPDMNGYEATKLIKKKRPELIVVAQTAHAVSEDKEKALKAGCDDFITKPIIQKDLIRIINKALNVG
ncbi:MAG: response regulator [Bacteroidales bacterium]|nr:response regulator [Bacteroidales bacterium]